MPVAPLCLLQAMYFLLAMFFYHFSQEYFTIVYNCQLVQLMIEEDEST